MNPPLERSYNISVKNDIGNPQLVYAYRTAKMLKVALTVTCGALARKESPAVPREDYPAAMT